MTTVLKIGPADHGQPISEEELHQVGDFEEGYKYEIIDGRLYVSHLPNVPEEMNEHWIYTKLILYSLEHPEVLNYVSNKARVFVPDRPDLTTPEPDFSGYRDFPLRKARKGIRWQDVSPILVGEVLSPNDPDKDLVRNVELYLLIPSIKEYWILDGIPDPDRPRLRVQRRQGKKWRIIKVPFGETYTTRLLPGFKIVIDPRK